MFKLAKVEPELANHLRVLRQASPESAKFITNQIFKDTMIPTMGNRLSFEDFQSRPRKGVHVSIDQNDLGPLNKKQGQLAGDKAIKAVGNAISKTSRQFHGKSWHISGDEHRLFFEHPEQAYAFTRQLHKNLSELPPLGGTHFHSVSAGIASSPEEADQALILAKNAKKARSYAPGHAETHVHSLLPGAAGPVNVAPKTEIPKGFINPKTSPVEGPAFQDPVNKSEDLELQELLLRKCELQLTQFAVLHDDPTRPMGVWRLENDQGQDPLSKSETPLNWPDKATAPKMAFISPERAEEWFGQDISRLRNEGFTLRRVPADKVWKSGKQVMYLPHKQ